MTPKSSLPKELRIFNQYLCGLSPEPNGGGQYVGDCPFCGADKHFYAALNGKNFKDSEVAFCCHRCGSQGNKFTFLKYVYQTAQERTPRNALVRLSKRRKGLPVRALMDCGVAYLPDLKRWIIPVRNQQGAITNLMTYSDQEGAPLIATTGLPQHLFGMETLSPDKDKVIVAEGHWDTMSLRHLLDSSSFHEEWCVIGAPGATNFPDKDVEALRGKEVWLMYDNDQAGWDGMQYVSRKIAQVASKVYLIDWPPGRFPEGYDLSDYVHDNRIKPDQAIEELLSWCHLADLSLPKTKQEEPTLIRTSVDQVISDFQKSGVHLYSGLRDALVIVLAVVESIRQEGEPLWLYLIGVSGAGKSLVLESTLRSHHCIYRTAITPRSMVSGFKGEEGTDPSLLFALPGKSLIVKDYSNVLSLPHTEQDQLFSLLREAYDGQVIRSYGNNVVRVYPPSSSTRKDCRFSMVAGVTPEIYKYHNTSLGERFLKFHITRSLEDDLRAIEIAMDNSWSAHQHAKLRAQSVAAFLERKLPQKEMVIVPDWMRKRIIALSQFVGYCRSHVSRTKEDLDYDPSLESGTRTAKQLLKLSIALGGVLGLKECDEEVYRLVKKVAWDTAYGKRRQVYSIIFSEGEMDATTLSKITGYSYMTCSRQLRDMYDLGLLLRCGKDSTSSTGRPKQFYRLRRQVHEVFKLAQLGEVE